MSDYGTMQTRIANELHRTDLTTQIQDAIQSAIQNYERIRFWFNHARASANTVVDQAYYALPLDFIEVDSFKILDSTTWFPLEQRTFQYIDAVNASTTTTGTPMDFAIYQEQIRLWPIPDDIYEIQMAYLRSLPALSASGDSNAWMTEGEELIRTRAMGDLYLDVIHDERRGAVMRQRERDAFVFLGTRGDKQNTSGRVMAYHF